MEGGGQVSLYRREKESCVYDRMATRRGDLGESMDIIH